MFPYSLYFCILWINPNIENFEKIGYIIKMPEKKRKQQSKYQKMTFEVPLLSNLVPKNGYTRKEVFLKNFFQKINIIIKPLTTSLYSESKIFSKYFQKVK